MKKSVTKINLYPYQDTDTQAIEKAWQEYRSILYQLPTGGGKSVVISNIVNNYRNEQIIIFAHKRRLLTQLHTRLNELGIDTGILFGTRSENLDAKVLVVSIRTAVKDARLEKILQRKWDRAIIDEARHSRTGSYDKVLDSLVQAYPTLKLLGVDATPYRKDGKRLDKHFQCMVVSTETTASLIEKGYLSKYRTYSTPIDKEELKERVKEAGGDYQSTELSHFMRQPQYIQYAIDLYKERGENRQTIVFAVDKAHAKDLKVAFEAAGFVGKVAQIDSDMSQQEIDNAFTAYESKKIQFLINVEMITEGVDLPDTGCILGLRPTKSLTLYLQIVGRGTRLKSDGSDLIILDCCGWTQEYGVLSSPKHWSLNPEIDPNNPRTKNKVVGKKVDGTFTEELEDFMGELIEMTPEEYVQHLSGGLENAKQVNVSIDDKIAALFKALAEVLIALMKSGYTKSNYKIEKYTRDTYRIYFFHNSISVDKFESYRYPHISVTLGADVQYIVPAISHERVSSQEQYERALHLNVMYGKLSELFINPEKVDKIKRDSDGLIEQIEDLEKSKINLDLIQSQAAAFKEEQWKKKIEDGLKTDNVIKLPAVLRDWNYFQKVGSYDDIVGIEFPNKAINKHHNTIILRLRKSHTEEAAVYTAERKYVKGEKVWEILKASEEEYTRIQNRKK